MRPRPTPASAAPPAHPAWRAVPHLRAPRALPPAPLRALAAGLLLMGLLAGLAPAQAADAPKGPNVATAEAHENPQWQSLRDSLFGTRPIRNTLEATPPAGWPVALDLPVRAADAATVPVAIRTLPAQDGGTHVRKVWLVIDRNPSPLGVVLGFTPESGRAEVATRVRVEEYTHVRAIAELSDGSLHMHTRFLKASGGCSAAPGGDLEAAKASLGRFKLRLDPPAAPGQPIAALLSISHPNVSGLAIDQFTRLPPKPHYVRRIEARYAGQPVLEADVDFTLSENPSLKFHFLPRGAGELQVTVLDSESARFQQSLALGADGVPVLAAGGPAAPAVR